MTSRRCHYCHSVLSDDDSLVHFGIADDAMEALGLNDPSEVREEHAVYMFLCSVCGTEAMLPTVQQVKAAASVEGGLEGGNN